MSQPSDTARLKIAILDAYTARTISCTELRILSELALVDAPQSYQQIEKTTDYSRRTLTRVMNSLANRGYVVRDGDNVWTLQPAALGVDISIQPPAPTLDTPIQGRHFDPGRLDISIQPGHFDPGDTHSIPTPQTSPPRAHPHARVFNTSSSSEMCAFNPNRPFDDPHDEDAARALVDRLLLNYPQARQAVRANPNGVDIPGWLDWLERTDAPSPMGTLVNRLLRGEPIPVIYSKRSTAPAPKSTVMPMPSQAELAEIHRRGQERRQARLRA